MDDENIDYEKLEKLVDEWIPSSLNKNIPRYSFIFHCNCAYVDAAIETGCFFSSSESSERYLVFALNYLTHLAYKYLQEEDIFTYEINDIVYMYAYKLLLRAYTYAELCDIFPKVHKGNASFSKKDNTIVVNEKNLFRDNMQQYEYYMLRKPLHYILQYGCGKTATLEMSERQMVILELFKSYWNENIWNSDYEPYSAKEGAGLRDFLIVTAAKRYILLYDADFKVRNLRWTSLLICFSQKGSSQIRTMIPTNNDKFYDQALEDCVFKPLGKGDYPKANLADAPIIKTKDGCMFVNPFLLLFNNSVDTQFLNYLRRHDNTRFLNIKDKIKERCIPEVETWLNLSIKKLHKVKNFELKIPHTKNKREFDLLVCDDKGNALYIEFKHFYLPESYSEKCNLDKELSEAQKKMTAQIYSITENSTDVEHLLNINFKLNRLEGIIVSYLYTGTDVEVSDKYPVINLSTIKQAIEKSTDLIHIYDYCQYSEKKSTNVPMIKKTVIREFANMKFEITKNLFDPLFETKANKRIYSHVKNSIDLGTALKRVSYKELNLSDLFDTFHD